MQLAYAKLFRIDVHHGFYDNGPADGVVELAPSPATARQLMSLGYRTRVGSDALGVYAEVEPDSAPPVLRRSLGGELVLNFVLRPLSPFLLNLSDLPRHRPGIDLFWLDNLADDQTGNALFLTDSMAGARIGAPLLLVSQPLYRHTLQAASTHVDVNIADLFGNTVVQNSLSYEGPVSEVALDLDALPAGRYRVTDSTGGVRDIFYDIDLWGGDVLGIISIFADAAPAAYQYLVNNEVVEREYRIDLPNRATTWQYVVQKQYDSNSIALADLNIVSTIGFDRTEDTDRVTFRSQVPVPLQQAYRDVALHGSSGKLLDLTNPGESTPLAGSPGSLESHLFVYV